MEGIDCIISYFCVSIKFIFRPSIKTKVIKGKTSLALRTVNIYDKKLLWKV